MVDGGRSGSGGTRQPVCESVSARRDDRTQNFYFVSIDGLEGRPDPDRLYACRTDEEGALTAKHPYRDIRMAGNVEGRFLFSTAVSRHVLPFALLRPAPVVLSLEEEHGRWFAAPVQALKRKGFRACADWFEEAEKIWIKARGAKSARQSYLQRLDYQKGLTTQLKTHRHLVLYNAAATNVSACYCDRRSLDLPFVVDHRLYWAAVENVREAHYLTAVLNSETANRAIKPFQSTGLLGERDVHKKLLDIPFPLFDRKNELHLRLSALALQADAQAQAALRNPLFAPNTSLAWQRAYVRTAVADVLSAIDPLVRELLALPPPLPGGRPE